MNDPQYTKGDIKVSIIISVLNSHEILRRQIEHFKKLNLPDDFEIIIMDDGSNPPLYFPNHGLKNLNIYPTGINIPWSQPYAKNVAAQIAKGEYLLITDIDHFFPPKTMECIKAFTGDKMMFRRRYAILDENGDIKNDKKSLVEYGLPAARYNKRKTRVNYHTNSFIMKSEIFRDMGGFKKKYWFDGIHSLEDSSFYTSYNRWARHGRCKPAIVTKNDIFVFPAPDNNVNVQFHHLNRWGETEKEKSWRSEDINQSKQEL